MTDWGVSYETDWDNPITYGEDEITLYPASSVFFRDIKSIYDLADSIYERPIDRIYTYDSSANTLYRVYPDESRLFFAEIDGKMYVNPDCIEKREGSEPFIQTSYIEIAEQSEDKCSLIWHYPDVDGLREPDKYIYYYYYEKNYTAVYSEGTWRLNEVITY